MKRLLLDCDGVLADFVGSAIDVINEMFGTSYMPQDVKGWDFTSSLGLAADDAAEVKRRIGQTLNFARRMRVLPGAHEGFLKLRELADVYVVTSPWNSNPTWMSDRETWLYAHFGIPHRRVIHTSAKHVCAGDFLVDDKTATCAVWQAHHVGGRAIQWGTPHNRLDEWTGARIDSSSPTAWDELCALVSEAKP